MPGPLQVLTIGFGVEADFQGRILAEIDRLEGRGIVRLLDVLVVAKAEDGTVVPLVIGDDEDYGHLLLAVLPLDGAGSLDVAMDVAMAGASSFDPMEGRELVAELAPGTALAFLLVEHAWAGPFFDVIADSGGVLLADGFLSPGMEVVVGAEMAAMEAAGRAIAEAQSAQADAILSALTAQAESAELVAEFAAVGNAAAAATIRTLITAGLVEEVAVHEAIDALIAAGLIVAAADEAATRALAVGAATVKAGSITLTQAQVLRYLPTPMTFAVIAGHLGISRGAAKERAERLYRKLDVHSRADAVARARDLGLLTAHPAPDA